MTSYCYEAVDSTGAKIEGVLDVLDQSEALRRIKEMGLFPIRIAQPRERRRRAAVFRPKAHRRWQDISITIPFLRRRVKSRAVSVFTRQIATLVEAGMPLLRGLRILQDQEANPALKSIIGEISVCVESGGSLSEALAAHPEAFNALYVNMARAGEVGGVLELTLRRLAEFMEKTQKIKGKVKSALVYPTAVISVALGVLILLMVFVVPRFREVFEGVLNGTAMPPFTRFVFGVSEVITSGLPVVLVGAFTVAALFLVGIRTRRGKELFDWFKLQMPLVGPVFRKLAICRFTRTLGTLLNSGVPILQALAIVKETSGNVVVARAIGNIHESVKGGDTITEPLKHSRVFPGMVVGMVDVGEQTGALPDMLLKIADNYEDEVDNAVSALTSSLEPILIVFLAVIVGSIVIAMFLPIIAIVNGGMDNNTVNPQGDI